jgi:hypothetical protein
MPNIADMRLSALEREYAMVHAAGKTKSSTSSEASAAGINSEDQKVEAQPDLEQEELDFDLVPGTDTEVKSDKPSEWATKPLAGKEADEIKKIASAFTLAPPPGGFPTGMAMPAWATKIIADSAEGGTAGKTKDVKKRGGKRKKKKGGKSKGAKEDSVGDKAASDVVPADWYVHNPARPPPPRPPPPPPHSHPHPPPLLASVVASAAREI